MLESAVEKWTRLQIQKAEGLFWKFTSPGNAGVPDRIAVLDGEVWFLEFKQDGGRTDPRQEYRIKQLTSAGANVKVITGMSGAKEFVGYLLRSRR